MTSLKKFKERLRGEHVNEEPLKLSIDIQPELVTETIIIEPATEEAEQVSIVDAVEPVIEDAVVPVIVDSMEPVIEDVVEDTAKISKLESMTKIEIDGYAAGHGIQLDRRQTKFNMITEFIQKIEEKN